MEGNALFYQSRRRDGVCSGRDARSANANMKRYLRALRFAFEVLKLGLTRPRLLAPLGIGILSALPVVGGYGAAYGFLPDRRFAPVILACGIVSLFFVVRLSGGLTCSLFYDHAVGLRPDVRVAVQRTVRSRAGLLLFGLLALPLEPLGGADWDRGNPVSRFFDWLARTLWTTSSYRVLPGMVVNGLGLRAALKSARERDRHDPTGLGAAYVGMIPTAYVLDLGALVGGLALCLHLESAHLVPELERERLLAATASLGAVALVWLFVDLVKVAYQTLFDLWATECAKKRPLDRTLAQPALGRVLPG